MFQLNRLIIGLVLLALTVHANEPSNDELNDLINSIFTSATPNDNVSNNSNKYPTAPGPTSPPPRTTGFSISPSTDSPISKDQNVCSEKKVFSIIL